MHSKHADITKSVLTIFRLNSLLLRKGDELALPFKITSAIWQILGAIHYSQEPISCPNIAESIGMTRQGALKQLNIAEKFGLVLRIQNPLHERSHLYALTKKGNQTYDSVMILQKKWMFSLFKNIALNDVKKILAVLSALETQLSVTPIPKEK